MMLMIEKNIHQQLDVPKNNSAKVMLSYKGPMAIEVIHSMCQDIEGLLGTHTVSGKKVYAIFMELVQNIFFYSTEICILKNQEVGVGSIVILDDGDFYTLVAGNFVPNDRVPVLEEKCRLINSLDRRDLRKLKLYQHESPNKDTNSKGAGVGLIQIALTSGEKLTSSFKTIDSTQSFFTLAVNVKRS